MTPTEKKCCSCKETKPAECFTRLAKSSDGLAVACRSCWKEISKRAAEARKARGGPKQPEVFESRLCVKCGVDKPRSEFAVQSATTYRKKCKQCVGKENWERQNATPEDREAYLAKQHEYCTSEHGKEVAKAYRLANPEQFAAKNRRSTQRRKSRIREQKRVYRATSPMYKPRAIARRHERRALIMGTQGDKPVTAADLVALRQRVGPNCAYCGLDAGTELEHEIPLKRGGKHRISNLTYACEHCNSSKYNRTPLEWFWGISVPTTRIKRI